MKPDEVRQNEMEIKMSENTNSKRPTHTIYKVTGEGGEGNWVKVGVAFQHKDGNGLALVFDGIPVEGRIAVRANRDRKANNNQHSLPLEQHGVA